MRLAVVRHARGVLLVVVAVLPWATASQGGLGGAGPSTTAPESAAAIESLTMLVVVTVDRPTVSIALKRTDGTRLLWPAPSGRSLHVPAGLLRGPWPAVPIERSEPLALHLAGRGPPLALEA